MERRGKGRPTDLELESLKVLWERGPGTVREVLDMLNRKRHAGYTTVLKMLQIMTEKELVVCDKRRRPHVYRPRRSQRVTLREIAGDVLERAFDGSPSQLLLHALDRKKATAEELAELTRLLDKLERGES